MKIGSVRPEGRKRAKASLARARLADQWEESCFITLSPSNASRPFMNPAQEQLGYKVFASLSVAPPSFTFSTPREMHFVASTPGRDTILQALRGGSAWARMPGWYDRVFCLALHGLARCSVHPFTNKTYRVFLRLPTRRSTRLTGRVDSHQIPKIRTAALSLIPEWSFC